MSTTPLTQPANSTPPVWPPATQAERDRLRDRAIAQAGDLRARAIADFWRDADEWISDAAAQSRRSADRLAARLRQHARQRAAARDSQAIET